MVRLPFFNQIDVSTITAEKDGWNKTDEPSTLSLACLSEAAKMDQRTAKAALRVYDRLVQGESISKRVAEKLQSGYDNLVQGESESKRAATELQASLRSAAAQKSEIDADMTVARTEAIIRLRPPYTAMQRAAQTNDFAAFQTAKEQYAQSFALEKAKHQAKKVKAQNRINAIDSDVKNKISELETTIKAQSPATAVGNGLNTAAAETVGRVTTVGNAVQDGAQGQFAASTVARNSDILNSEGIGSEQGSTEGVEKRGKPKLVPPTKEIKEKFDSEGLTQDKIDYIVSLPKSQKQKPETYLSDKYIEEHKQSFEDSGVVKIMPSAPTGTIGGKGGTFVMSGDQLDNIIKYCQGDISKIEDALGFDRGYLEKNPVIVEMHEVSGLRLPQGNEMGALPEYWLPGGYTIGGIKEAVIDPAPIGTYTYRHLF